MAVLGLRFCAKAFSSCGKRGPLFIAVRRPLTIAASLVAEHRLQARRLSSCGSRAHLLRGMWDPPRPGLEPMSPASAGRFPTTAPPGKPQKAWFDCPGFNVRLYAGNNSKNMKSKRGWGLPTNAPSIPLSFFSAGGGAYSSICGRRRASCPTTPPS